MIGLVSVTTILHDHIIFQIFWRKFDNIEKVTISRVRQVLFSLRNYKSSLGDVGLGHFYMANSKFHFTWPSMEHSHMAEYEFFS
jgi:hypothetical protein